MSAALIGTNQQPFIVPTANDRLGSLLSQLKGRSTEAALLLTAATITLHDQAGWHPEKYAGAIEEPCDRDDLPRCCPRAAYLLQQMLQGRYAQVLSEWCAIAAKHQQRVPEQNLPELLNFGKQHRRLRPAILPILGQRGRWLAAQNPDWRYAVEVDTEWETSDSAARSLYLQELRSHHPDQARTFVQSTWNQESASDRVKFLETFSIGLSMADEPFLEAALGDRSKEVRRMAAAHLASLPESRLAQRMSQRLEALLTLKVAAGRAFNFTLELPESCDAAMQRDGIEVKPRSGVGERAWWLLQIIKATPLRFWEQSGKIDAKEWLKIGRINEWKIVILEGWRFATQHQQNSEWAQAFLANPREMNERELTGLLGVLGSEQRAEFVEKALSEGNAIKDEFLWNVVSALTQDREPLNDQFARFMIAYLYRYVSHNNLGRHWRLREVLKDLALYVSPNLLSEAMSIHSEAMSIQSEQENSAIAASFDDFLSILQFRAEMLQAFELTAQR
jgi:hypothetical protein